MAFQKHSFTSCIAAARIRLREHHVPALYVRPFRSSAGNKTELGDRRKSSHHDFVRYKLLRLSCCKGDIGLWPDRDALYAGPYG